LPTQLSFFEESRGPKGLLYRPEFITCDEEQELIARIQKLPLTPFQFGKYEGKRRVSSFGFHYNFSTQALENAATIPDWIRPTISLVEKSEKLMPGTIGHVLFTEYEAGTGIGWHRDKKQFNEVFGLSLGSSCKFRFRRLKGKKWERFTLHAAPRSLYAITGESREMWEHSIPPVGELRYSITFRTMAL
jgi:alkylated DNA repair dioxygenase AlkB